MSVKNFEEPNISDEIQEKLKHVYAEARKTYNPGVKINPRFLESLTRMAVSSAKLRQSKEVESKDINVSLKILAQSQYKVSETINI